jgi:hypothetical protein
VTFLNGRDGDISMVTSLYWACRRVGAKSCFGKIGGWRGSDSISLSCSHQEKTGALCLQL